MLRVQDFMSTGVATISPRDSSDLASESMDQNDVHHLVVMDRGKPVGIVSSHDLGAKSNGKDVSEVMSPQVISVVPRATVREVANLLRGRRIGCVPVLDKGKLQGIVTISDLLELLGRGAQRAVPKGERPNINRNKSSRNGKR